MDVAALTSTSRAVVEARAVVKRYGERTAVAGASLVLGPGLLYGLIGPDGGGKSSLLKVIAGVLTHEAGDVRVFGIPMDSEAAAERVKDRIGFMPQGLGLNLYPELSVEENIDFFARLRLVPRAELEPRKAQMLAMTRLERFRARPMKQLSGGMKQKLGLICTLIHQPELIILDEPTTGVDPVSRREFWRILAQLLRERGMTALVSTAYLDEASRFDRVALMYAGEIVAEGEPRALREGVAASVVRLRGADGDAARALGERFAHVQARGSDIAVLVPGAAADAALSRVQQALPRATAAQLSVAEPDLEDLFVLRVQERTRGAGLPALAARAVARNARTPDGDAIEARGLTRDFGAFRAVEGVSFRVARGEIFGLLGANGAGKTTVIKMLTGILPPSAGSGHVAGADMRRAGRQIKQRVGYMSQAFSLYTDLTAEENVRLYAGIYGLLGRDARRRSDEVLALGGLAEHRRDAAGSLPMGLRQRLALGCALVHRPQVLFLDEPTSGVDPLGRRQFWNILFWLAREEAVAILLTTHHMSEAELCDHLVLMYDGRSVADATPDEMKSQVRRELGSGAAADLTMEDVFVHRVTQLQRAAATTAPAP